MARVRLGVALLLRDPVRTEINGIRRALGDDGLDRIEPHITLVPPVNVHVEQVPQALALVRSIAARTEPFTLTLGPVQTFAPQTPVIKLDVGGDLIALQSLRDSVFVDPLARELTWPFVPHVTLRDDADEHQLLHAVQLLHGFQATATIDDVVVLQEGAGRKWTSFADARFEPPVVIGTGGLPLELSTSTRIDAVTAETLNVEPSDENITVVARREGCSVGVVAGRLDGGHVTLRTLAVAGPQQRQGIGSHLVNRLLYEASRAGAVQALSDLDNPSNFRHLGVTDYTEVADVREGSPCEGYLARFGFRDGCRRLS